MKQTLQPLMPARCSRCGAWFDLQYDLSSLGEGLLVEHIGRTARVAARAKLCWNCRV